MSEKTPADRAMWADIAHQHRARLNYERGTRFADICGKCDVTWPCPTAQQARDALDRPAATEASSA